MLGLCPWRVWVGGGQAWSLVARKLRAVVWLVGASHDYYDGYHRDSMPMAMPVDITHYSDSACF